MRHPVFASSAIRLWPFALVLALLAASSTPALAQIGRIQGVVRDELGKPIRGATVVAENPNAAPSSFTTTTDEKGHWGLLGLRIGFWRFTATAPGYESTTGTGRIEGLGSTANLEIKLLRTLGALEPGVLNGVELKSLQNDLDSADALFAAAKYADAIIAYNAVLKKAPALTSVKLRVGEAQRLEHQYEDALRTLGEIPPNDLAAGEATREIGLTYLDKGDLDRAEEVLDAAAARPDASSTTMFAAGEVQQARGKQESAAQWFEKAAAADPGWPKPVLQLGVIAANAGNRSAAVPYFEKVIAIAPDSPEATQARTILSELSPR